MKINSNYAPMMFNNSSNISRLNFSAFSADKVKKDEFVTEQNKLINKFLLKGKISPVNYFSLKSISKQNDISDDFYELLKLVDDKLLSAKCLKFITKNGELKENIKENINSPYIHYFDDKQNAVQNCEIGDIFKLSGNNNLYVKTGENEHSDIKTDEETFLKLFPQLQKYSSSQKNSTDCYLVSTINAILDNKNTAHFIYDCFEQTGDDINIKFNGSDSVYTYKNAKPKNNNTLVSGALGIKLLQHAYGKYLEEIIYKNAINTQNLLIKEKENLLNSTPDEKSKKHLRTQISKLKNVLFQLEQDRKSKSPELIVDINSELLPITNDETGINLKSLYTLNTFTKSAYKSTADYYRNNCGYPEYVFNAFALEDTNIFSLDDEKLLDILTNPDEYKKYLFVGGTKHEGMQNLFRQEKVIDNHKKLFGSHAYRIIPFQNEKGEILYKASNPWNSSHDLILSLDDLKNTFLEIDIAKIS